MDLSHPRPRTGRTPVTLLALSVGPIPTRTAAAQQSPEAAASAPNALDLDRVDVNATYRESLQQSLDGKRYRVEQVDTLHAEDIGTFPDLKPAEAMQRIARVSINRESGERPQRSVQL